VAEQEKRNSAFSGKTYSLYGDTTETDKYYRLIRNLTDLFLQKCPDEEKLLSQIQKASDNPSFIKKLSRKNIDKQFITFLKQTLRDSLTVYTRNVKHHLKTLPLSQRFDSTLRTKEEQYHLYMIEIELVNRIYKEAFKRSKYKFALIAHCLRDFRPDCRSVPGDIEAICKGCTEECFINIGSHLLKKYNIHPYISITMELEELFKKLKAEHPSIGALGIACIPELINGVRLCIKLGIPPVGIPLDANRCARWMKQAHETSFNLKELEDLIKYSA
jgi:hypothetical protein